MHYDFVYKNHIQQIKLSMECYFLDTATSIIFGIFFSAPFVYMNLCMIPFKITT